MKVFAIYPCLSYSGGCIIVSAESESDAWRIVKEKSTEISYYSVEDFGIKELPLRGEKEGILFESVYIE